MSAELSKDADELVREGQLALRPTADDKRRIFAALQARIQHEAATEGDPGSLPNDTAGAGLGQAGVKDVVGNEVAGSNSSTLAALGKYALIAGGLVASFVGLSNLRTGSEHQTSEPLVPTIAVATTSSPAPMVSPAVSVVASASALLSEPAPSARPSVTRSPDTDSLAAEAALLSQAEKALHAGDLNRALTLTTQHRKKFPKGLMARERVNIRLQSLCGLGRDKEADSEFARSRGLGKVQPGQACHR